MIGFLIGVTGGSSSGKTTLAELLLKNIGEGRATYLKHDSYYKDQSAIPTEERDCINYDHPDVFDNDLFARHVDALKSGLKVEAPTYDFVTHTRTDKTITVEAASIIILDGILLFHDNVLRDLIELKIYVDTDNDLRLARRIKRDVSERGRTVNSVVAQYLNTVKPMHEKFVKPQKEYADMIISGNSDLKNNAKVVLSRIMEMTL